MSTETQRHETGICASCGADEGLHQSSTNKCPLYGREESRWDKLNNRFYPQQWEETRFEDKGVKDFEKVAITNHQGLLEALKRLAADFHKNYAMFAASGLHEPYNEALAAINAAEEKQ